jgi:hypothetical protein
LITAAKPAEMTTIAIAVDVVIIVYLLPNIRKQLPKFLVFTIKKWMINYK